MNITLPNNHSKKSKGTNIRFNLPFTEPKNLANDSIEEDPEISDYTLPKDEAYFSIKQ